jgi:hypothetical protein
MLVYRSWLKQYINWFDPDIYIYLQAHADGMNTHLHQRSLEHVCTTRQPCHAGWLFVETTEKICQPSKGGGL